MANVKQTIDMIKICFQHNAVPALISQHGTGKTMLFEEIAKDEGIEFLPLQMSQLEPPDFVGLPQFPDEFEIFVKGVKGRLISTDGKTAVVLLNGSIQVLSVGELDFSTYEKTTKHIRPDFLPHPLSKSKGIILLDEINRARADVRAALYDFILYRRIMKYVLPEGWKIACAMNPSGGEYQVAELDPALKDRLVFIRFAPTAEEWVNFESGQGGSDVTNFIKSNNRLLDGVVENFEINVTPSRRSWSLLNRISEGDTVPTDIKKELYAGVVGVTGAVEFIKYLDTIKTTKFKWADLKTKFDNVVKEINTLASRSEISKCDIVLSGLMASLKSKSILAEDIDLLVGLCQQVKLSDIVFKHIKDLVTDCIKRPDFLQFEQHSAFKKMLRNEL